MNIPETFQRSFKYTRKKAKKNKNKKTKTRKNK